MKNDRVSDLKFESVLIEVTTELVIVSGLYLSLIWIMTYNGLYHFYLFKNIK